jgi:hypothetical protein
VEEKVEGSLNFLVKLSGQGPLMSLLAAISDDVRCVLNLLRESDDDNDASEGWYNDM